MTPFVEASRELVRSLQWWGSNCSHNGIRLNWRHHGLGMLQAELTDTLRIHIWHPKLIDPKMAWPRCVHDHRFDITSAVVVGEVIDQIHHVRDSSDSFSGYEVWPVKVYEIEHAKEQDRVIKGGYSTATSAKFLVNAWVCKEPQVVWPADREYFIPRRAFHTTIIEELAITVVHRSRFDNRLARVLCDTTSEVAAMSGIVHDDSIDHRVLISWVLREASDAIANIK